MTASKQSSIEINVLTTGETSFVIDGLCLGEDPRDSYTIQASEDGSEKRHCLKVFGKQAYRLLSRVVLAESTPKSSDEIEGIKKYKKLHDLYCSKASISGETLESYHDLCRKYGPLDCMQILLDAIDVLSLKVAPPTESTPKGFDEISKLIRTKRRIARAYRLLKWWLDLDPEKHIRDIIDLTLSDLADAEAEVDSLCLTTESDSINVLKELISDVEAKRLNPSSYLNPQLHKEAYPLVKQLEAERDSLKDKLSYINVHIRAIHNHTLHPDNTRNIWSIYLNEMLERALAAIEGVK